MEKNPTPLEASKTLTDPLLDLSDINPLLSESYMEERFGGYDGSMSINPLPSRAYTDPVGSVYPLQPFNAGGGDDGFESLVQMGSKKRGGKEGLGKTATLDEFAENFKGRYDSYLPGINNEEAYAHNQGWGSKMVNGVAKGLVLTASTFLQSTVGLVNGVFQSINDKNFSSFYNNDFNNWLDENLVKPSEDWAPNYYKQSERDASWYSPSYWATGNFLWDGVVKNLGFAAGAALSGGVFTGVLKSLPLTARLFSINKGAETLAAVEAGLASSNKVAGTYGKIRGISDKFLSQYNSLNPAGRYVVAGLATTGEAGIEALHNSNEFRQELIDDYVAEYGVQPTGIELDRINKITEGVGNSVFMMNVGVLSATNYIQFPKILGSTYRGEKNIVNGLVREIDAVAIEAGKLAKRTPKYPFLDKLNKIRPYTFSISEAGEEMSQFVASTAAQDYYDKKYNNEATDWVFSIGLGMQEAFSDDGLKEGLIGGLSGSIMLGRGRYIQNSRRAENTVNAINEINKFKLSQFTKETFDSVNRGTALQEQREQQVKDGDISGSKDTEADYIINYLTPRIKYDRYELVKADINEYRNLASSDAGFAQLQEEGKALPTDTREAYMKRLDSLEKTADNVFSLWQSLNLRYSGQMDKDGKPLYTPDVMNKMIYAATKVANYDERIPELSLDLVAAGLDVNSIIDDVLQGNTESFKKGMSDIQALDILGERKDELAVLLQDVATLNLKRKAYLQLYEDIKNSPTAYVETEKASDVTDAPQVFNEDSPKINLAEKGNPKEFFLEKPYVVIGAPKFDKDGNVKVTPLFLKIVDENEDGSVKVQNEDGSFSNMSKQDLINYRLIDPDQYKDDPNFQYYLEHANNVFTHAVIGGDIKGKIQYNPKNKRLEFVFSDKKGRQRTKSLTPKDFVAQKGYQYPMLRMKGALKPSQKKAIENIKNAPQPTISEMTKERLEILNDFYKGYMDRLRKLDTTIKGNNTKVSNILKKIKELEQKLEVRERPSVPGRIILSSDNKRKVYLNFRNNTKSIVNDITKLQRTKNSLEQSLEKLTDERESLQAQVDYVNTLIDIADSDGSNADFLKMLREDYADLQELKTKNENLITHLQDIIAEVAKAIKAAIDHLTSFVKTFESKYPEMPSLLVDDWGTQIMNNPEYLQDDNVYADALELIDQINLVEPQLEIPAQKATEEKYLERLEVATFELAEIEKALELRKPLLEKFEQIEKEYQKQLQEEKAIAENKKLVQQLIGVGKNNLKTRADNSSYEPVSLKPDVIVITSGRPVDGEAVQNRINEFSSNESTMRNRESLKGVFVTANNEEASGFQGLVDHDLKNLPLDKSIPDTKKTKLLFVIVDEDGNPVNKLGQVIAKDNFDEMLYQSFPDIKLENAMNAQNNYTMFRKTTPEALKQSLAEQYVEWKKEKMAMTEMSEMFDFSTSFGVPILNKKENADGTVNEKVVDTDKRVSAVDANLINNDDLITDPVLRIPTTSTEVTEGTSTVNVKEGGVALVVPNKGVAKVFNRNLTKVEATAIYDVLYHISKQSLKPGALDLETTELFDWLKSIVYWGRPQEKNGELQPGYNSVWFDTETEASGKKALKLYISGKSKNSPFYFYPSELETNKTVIIELLTSLFHNINADNINPNNSGRNSWKNSYRQITGISKDGVIQAITWPNYQTYLLSNKTPDAKGNLVNNRAETELPLYTQYRPVTEENPVNRMSVYFYLNEGEMLFNTEVPKESQKNTKSSNNKQKVTKFKDLVPGQTYEISFKGLGTIYYTVSGKKTLVIKKTMSEKAFNAQKERLKTKLLSDGSFTKEELTNAKLEEITSAEFISKISEYLLSKEVVEVPESVTSENKFGLTDEELIKFNSSLHKTALLNLSKVIQSSTNQLEYIIAEDGQAYAPDLDGIIVNYHTTKQGLLAFTATSLSDIEIDVDESADAINNFKSIIEKQVADSIIAKRVVLETPPPPVAKKAVKKAKAKEKPIATVQPTEEQAAPPQQPTLFDTLDQDILEEEGLTNLRDELNNSDDNDFSDVPFRYRFTSKNTALENWNKIEDFLKQNFPNIPIYRVKNMITDTNGREAWGMLQNGAIYVYENAEIGTVYHEVFEAVWKAFTSVQEQVNIINEFRNREGSYYDVFSGTNIKYSEASDKQVKEQLAEEFAAAVANDKIGNRSTPKTLIGRLFRDLIDFIKGFFISQEGKSQIDELFSKIGNGYYSRYTPFGREFSFAEKGIIDIDSVIVAENAEFRRKTKFLSFSDANALVEDMLYNTISSIVQSGESIFKVEKPNFQELSVTLKNAIKRNLLSQLEILDKSTLSVEEKHKEEQTLSKLWTNVQKDWKNLFYTYTERLQSFGMKFDENDTLILEDEDNSGKSDYQAANKIDKFRKTNAAIKLLFSSLPKTLKEGRTLKVAPSSVYGASLLPSNLVRMTLINKLSSALTVEEMMERLRSLAKEKPEYQVLYNRLTNNRSISTKADYSRLETHHFELLSGFFAYMKNQGPDVVTVHLFSNGDIYVGDTILTSSSQQSSQEMENTIIQEVRNNKSPYFAKVSKGWSLKINPKTKNNAISDVTLSSKSIKSMTDFLTTLGVDFDPKLVNSKLSNNQKEVFTTAVKGLQTQLASLESLQAINSRSLGIVGYLKQLGVIKAVLENTEFESTYFDINGERAQVHMNPNTLSSLHDAISSIDSLEELSTPGRGFDHFRYLLTDPFAKNSWVLEKIFNMKGETKKKIKGTSDILKPVLIDGMNNERDGKRRESSKFTFRQRIIEELNVNAEGIYHVLVPADASLEYSVRLHDKGNPFISKSTLNSGEYLNRIGQYLADEIELARDDRKVAIGDSADLRFFKYSESGDSFMSKSTYDKIMLDMQDDSLSGEVIYEMNKKAIDKDFINFVKIQTEELSAYLQETGTITLLEDPDTNNKLVYSDEIAFITQGASLELYNQQLQLRTLNYIVANMEMFKLVFSDPYQYKDGLKRFKSFMSPRQALMGGSEVYNNALDKKFNEGYQDNDKIGRVDFTRNYLTSTTLEDVISYIPNMPNYDQAVTEETDGSGLIGMQGLKNFWLRAGQWNDDFDRQYRYDVAYQKVVENKELSDLEKEFNIQEKTLPNGKKIFVGDNPGVMALYTAIKPVVSGNTGDFINDPLIDKFALFPISFRIMHEFNPNSNMVNLVKKMQEESVDYAVFNSGRKVSSAQASPVYDGNGKFVTKPFNEIKNIPIDIIGLQTEVPTKDSGKNSRGTQMTKLVTLDLMQAGVPIDFNTQIEDINERVAQWYSLTEKEQLEQSDLFKEIQNNRKLLEAKMNVDYNSLLIDLGIQRVNNNNYKIVDKRRTVDILRTEFLKREINDNILDAIDDFMVDGVLLEATPAYQQIRNILYSIANNSVIRPKISGAQLPQMSSALFEENRIKPKKLKNSKGQTIPVYESDILEFYSYKEGDKTVNVAEIFLSRWFDSPLSDDELIEFLNTTEEGQKILRTVAFRIPTQKQNSIDVFKIKKFLPKDFGGNVVVPSALVRKVGSDFDIDKLSIYYRNLKIDKKGYPSLINLKEGDTIADTQDRFADYVDENIGNFRDIHQEVKEEQKELKKYNLDRAYSDYADAREDRFTTKNELEVVIAMGYEYFSNLPIAIKQEYFQLESDFKAQDFNGVVKNLNYRAYTKDLIKDYKKKASKNKSITLTYQDVKTKQTVTTQEDLSKIIPILELMLGNYDDINQLFNISKKQADIISEKLEEARTEKKDILSAFRFELAEILSESVGMEDFATFSQRPLLEQNSKKALENAYIDSLNNLITHPLNYERLVKPNSAEKLKTLSENIHREKGLKVTDYTDIHTYVKPLTMSKIRHSFVSGKYGVGIGATSQTNNAMNQRALITLLLEKALTLSNNTDKEFLTITDTEVKINFKNYNKIFDDGQIRPTLSFPKNADGEYISDIIGAFIDGYVDIAKGSWIMDLGASPNVAGTWLFLVKLGVPFREIAYFINQPIIQKYLQNLENSGYTYLFNSRIIEKTLDDFNVSFSDVTNTEIPNETVLKKTLKFNTKPITDMSSEQLSMQAFYLADFLKYSKMAEHLFKVQQASNYDTSVINDSSLLIKKDAMLEEARETIISSVDKLLDSSFIGLTKEVLSETKKAFSEIIVSDKGNISQVITKLLRSYTNVPDKEFLKISKKAVMDLFDWAVFTFPDFNLNISELLVSESKQKSVVDKIMDYATKAQKDVTHIHHNNPVIKNLRINKADRDGKVDNLVIANRDNTVYDRNVIINSFDELRETLPEDLYLSLVKVAIAQSGLTTSKISFTQLVPYEDFKKFYNNAIYELDQRTDLNRFINLNVFERVNWNNPSVVGQVKANMKFLQGNYYNAPGMSDVNHYFTDKKLTNATAKGKLPFTIASSMYGVAAQKDFIVYSYEDKIPYKQRAQMKEKGDFSFMHRVLMRKVYQTTRDGVREPLIQETENPKTGTIYRKYVYVAVNAWGDSFRAREFYDVQRPSVLDNGMDKVVQQTDDFGEVMVSGEINDDQVIRVFYGNNEFNGKFVRSEETEWQLQEKDSTEEDLNCPLPPF